MKRAALGFRAHSGWTAMVALSLDKDGPSVLLRERPKLVETFTYEFRQPYHTAEKMPLDKAREFISRVASGAKHLAEKATLGSQNPPGTGLSTHAIRIASHFCQAAPEPGENPLLPCVDPHR